MPAAVDRSCSHGGGVLCTTELSPLSPLYKQLQAVNSLYSTTASCSPVSPASRTHSLLAPSCAPLRPGSATARGPPQGAPRVQPSGPAACRRFAGCSAAFPPVAAPAGPAWQCEGSRHQREPVGAGCCRRRLPPPAAAASQLAWSVQQVVTGLNSAASLMKGKAMCVGGRAVPAGIAWHRAWAAPAGCQAEHCCMPWSGDVWCVGR